MNHLILVLKSLRMEESNTSYSSESSYDWMDQRWYCGVPDGRCPHCGLPKMFPPACLGLEVYRYQARISRTFTLEVRFSRVQAFTVNIIEGEITLRPSARSHQSTFSGRTLLARNENPGRPVLEASPRAYNASLRSVIPRPAFLQPFNFDFLPANAPRRASGQQGAKQTNKQSMQTKYLTACGWTNQCSGITKNTLATLLAVVCLCAGASLHAAPDLPVNPAGSDLLPIASNANGAPNADTNSPVSAIAADLQRIKARIETAVSSMSNAAASTPALQAAKVTKLADEITELGTKDLGDQGEIVKQADNLIAKFNESVSKARSGSDDPNIGPKARAIYGEVGPRIEAELAKLIDARSTVTRIRTELLRQAEGLRQSADAIGFAEHANQLMIASQAFRDTLSEVNKFAEKISTLIQSVGNGQQVPLT